MSGKWTPGPWYASPPIPDEEGIRPDTFTIGTFEAMCHHEDTICEVWDGNHIGKTNARLIAAAPDLLEAAQGAVNEETLHGNVVGAMRALRAAIKKATEES